MAFNHIGEYKCVCGKCYTSSQAYVGHKARCKVYQKQKRGEDYDNWVVEYEKKLTDASQETAKKISELAAEKKKLKEQEWLDEGHYCEKCGKLITKRIGTGRFCSRSCANTRQETAEVRFKISSSLRKNNGNDELTFDEFVDLKSKEKNEKKIRRKYSKEEIDNYLSDVLPQVDHQKNSQGWKPRNVRWSYPEKFWKQVFDNNNVDYIHGQYVHNEKTGKYAAAYELDFLIDGIYDIEIDGGTHTKFKDVKEKDIRRDKYLTSIGYIVYRIPWINPISIDKKDAVYNQIVELFDFLGKELITKK